MITLHRRGSGQNRAISRRQNVEQALMFPAEVLSLRMCDDADKKHQDAGSVLCKSLKWLVVGFRLNEIENPGLEISPV